MLDGATLLDAEGVEALTMRRLAAELGVSAMAPYRHVGSKDQLLMVLIDRLAALSPIRHARPDRTGALLVLWSTIYDSLAEHPWVPECRRCGMIAPRSSARSRRSTASLHAAGLSIEQMVRAYRLLSTSRSARCSPAPARAPKGRANSASCGSPDPARFPLFAAAAGHWTAADDHDTYREDLAALIDAPASELH